MQKEGGGGGGMLGDSPEKGNPEELPRYLDHGINIEFYFQYDLISQQLASKE